VAGVAGFFSSRPSRSTWYFGALDEGGWVGNNWPRMMPSKGNDTPDIPVVVGRRSARLSVIIPITIKGVARNGTPFKENTWTISVNKQGARLFAFHEVTLGDEVTVENPVLGRAAKARVVRVCEKSFPEDPYEIALELMDAQNVWGVKFPPEDWQKEKPAPPATRGAERPPLPPLPSPASGGIPYAPTGRGAKEADHAAEPSGMAPPEGTERAEKFSQFNLAVTGLSQFARQSGEGEEKQPPAGEERLAYPPGPAEPISPAYYQEALRLLEDKIKKILSLEKDLDSLLKRLEDSRVEAGASLTKIHEAGQQFSAEAEKVRRDIHETTEQALASSLEKAKLKIQEGIAAASSVVTDQAQKRVQEEIRPAIESLLKAAEARLAGLKEDRLSEYATEFRARHAELAERAEDEVLKMTVARAEGINEKIKKLADETSASLADRVRQSFEPAAQRVADRHLAQLKELAQSVHGELETSARQNLQHAQGEIQKQIANAEEKLRLLCEQGAEGARAGIAQSLRDASDALKKTATESLAQLETGRQKLGLDSQEVLEDFRKRLAELSTQALEGSRNYTETRLQSLKGEVEEAIGRARDKGLQEASDRLQKLGEETLRSSSEQFQKTIQGDLQRMKERVAASEKEVVEGIQKKLFSVGQTTLEDLLLDAKAAGEDYRAHLHKLYQESLMRGERDLVAHLQSTLGKLHESVTAQLEKEAEATKERISADLKSRGVHMVEEATDTMYKQIGVAAVTMKSWSDDARAQLETYFQKSLAERLEQIGEFSQASLLAYRSELRALTAEFSSRLESASRLLREQPPHGAKDPGDASPGPVAGPPTGARPKSK